MTPERWQEVQDVLEKALAIAPSERSAYLNQACSSDPSLRQEVETLLACNDDQRSSFLQSSTHRVALAPGTKLGDYEVKSSLGSGGMGEVYRARDSRLGRDVAIKVLPLSFAADSDRLRRFEQEARAAAALEHPNILAVHQLGTFQGAPYLVSELLEGKTLREQITCGRLSVRKAIAYGVQIARGLAAAHEKGIVHRDLKPENLFVTKDGRVKILDFGLAKLTQPQSSSPHSAVTLTEGTEAGVVMGTVGYMSPEQVRGQTADHRADIFAFGAILYEMLAGKRAFQRPTSPETMAAILNEDPPGISGVAANVPPALQRVVHRCLEKDPGQRFQSASDLAFALDALSDLSSGPASSATTTKAATAGRKRWKVVIPAAAVVLALSVAGYFYFHPKIEPFQKTEILQLTTAEKAHMATISPDGRYVAYVSGELFDQSLWVAQIAGGNDVQVVAPDKVAYQGLTFSSNGDFIYFVRSQATNLSIGILYRMPTFGGTPEKLITDVDSPVTLSPDGKQLAFVRGSPDKGESALMAANEDGTGEKQLAIRRLPNGLLTAAWSPNGNTIAMLCSNVEGKVSYTSLAEIPVSGGPEHVIGKARWAGWLFSPALSWIPDGRGLIMTGNLRNWEPIQIEYVPYPNGDVRKITNDLNSYYGVSLTATAGILATVQAERSDSIWVAPLAEPDRGKPITSEAGAAVWTRDGRIIYVKLSGTGISIWVMEPDGRSPRPLGSNKGALRGIVGALPRVSADGRHVVFISDRTGGIHVWRMDIDGGDPRQLTNSPNDAYAWPDISPDGKWVVYSKEGDEKGIWKVPMDGGGPVRLTYEFSGSPAVSPDGKSIAYTYIDPNATPQRRLAIIGFDGGPAVKVFGITAEIIPRPLRWMPDGRSILYIKGSVSNIWNQPLAGGEPKQITHFDQQLPLDFDVSGDGKYLVMDRFAESNHVTLIRDAR
jgi:Tol biopolymer transport system component